MSNFAHTDDQNVENENQAVSGADEENIKHGGSGQEHSFLMDQTYVEELLDSFKKGKLNAFDENCSLEKMKKIKISQEKLAQLHFDLENEETNKSALSEDERMKKNQEKMDKLMKNMESLCSSVQSLHQHTDAE